MGDKYKVDCAKRAHDENIWDWNRNHDYYFLKGVGQKGYNCSEYSLAKVTGRPPRYGGDGSQTCETNEIEQELRNLGFKDGNPAEECGCKKGQKRACVVLYFAKDASGGLPAPPRDPVHVAVFDPELCDWGGKPGARGPTRRYKDYDDWPHDQDARNDTVHLFLCRDKFPYEDDGNAATRYHTDKELHDAAVDLDAQPAPPSGGGQGCALALLAAFALLLASIGALLA